MDYCYCHSQLNYENCCEPLHQNKQFAQTAEQLMRSRYSAFVVENIEYLIQTHHPKTRNQLNKTELTEWAKSSDWKKLVILDTVKGRESDREGVVEFQAHYENKGEAFVHHERSHFVFEDGRWFYFDGVMADQTYVRDKPKVGRNDPCPCGSGKKYKKCCL
jgi:SEC-C motif-containing protein